MPVSALLAVLSLPWLAGVSREVEPASEPAKPESPVLPEPPELPEPPDGPELPPEPDAVRWVAPVGCPSAPDLRRGIERRLGRTLAPGEANVEAQVDPQAQGGYRLVLRTSAAGVVDERVLEADDCRALADATALVVALAIDPVAVAEAMEAFAPVDEIEAPPTETPPVAPAPARRDATTTELGATEPRATPGAGDEASERSLRPGGLLRVGAGVGLGALPGVTGVPSLAAGLRWRRARLELEGTYWIPRVSDPVEGARVAVQLGAATVRGCGQLGRDRLEAPLCGGVQLGGMRGQGRGVPDAHSAQGLWVALEASMGLSWWFRPRWALAGGFVAAVPVRQPAFELTDDPPVRLFEPSAVVGRVWLGIELRLGPS